MDRWECMYLTEHNMFSSVGGNIKKWLRVGGQTELGSNPAFAQGLAAIAREDSLIDCVSLDKLSNLFGPQFSHLKQYPMITIPILENYCKDQVVYSYG